MASPEGDSEGDPEVIDGVEEAGAVVPPVLVVAAEAEAAEDPLTKEPVPHGIFAPSGWVDWAGATTSLAEPVIVKRPVQVLFVVDGDVN